MTLRYPEQLGRCDWKISMTSGGSMEKLFISTSAFAAQDQLEAFRETFGRSILHIDIEPLPGQTVESEMFLQSLPGISIGSGLMAHANTRHTAELADNDDLVLVFMNKGHGILDQYGCTTVLAEGSVAVTANGEPATLAMPTRTHLLNVRLSRKRLFPKLANISDIFRAPVLRRGPELQLLKSYAAMLDEGVQSMTPPLKHSAAAHLYDLAALALGATRDATALARGRGVRAARLHAIKGDILAGLTDADLSVDRIARRHGITPGYIRKLFADEGTTFTDFLLDQRLAQAHRRLTGPHPFAYPISQIVLDCGFSDISYFNRRFRNRYGATPSEIRANARDAESR
jgi:AraC-like DNA-binding protein